MATRTKSWSVLLAALFLPCAAAFGGAPRFHHHDQRHEHEEQEHNSDRGAHPSKAERLGLVVQSRALLDKSGTTTFELTTGQLDSSAPAPGNVHELHLRVRRGKGKKGFEKEWEHLRGGGYVSYPLAGLGHGEVIDVKAEISRQGRGRGDRDRDDHEGVDVKLQDVVKYRPDLAVQTFDYPTSAHPDTDVQFSATLGERLGDLGAHADCVLVVDGQQVDAAKGIWIDARGVVTCRFTYRFKTAGMHSVSAQVQNASPATFDPSPCSMSGQILIRRPSALSYTAQVFESTTVLDTTTDYFYKTSSTTPDRHDHNTITFFSQGRYFSGSVPAAVILPLKSVSYSDTSGSSPIGSLSYADVAADTTSASSDPAFTTESVIQRFDTATSGWMTLHRYLNESTGLGVTTVDWSWDAGETTYHSDGYCKSTVGGFQCSGGDYTVNTTSASGSGGPKVALASDYAADVQVNDGTCYSAQPSMALTPSSQVDNPPTTCDPQEFTPGTPGQVCYQSSTTTTGKDGSDSR